MWVSPAGAGLLVKVFIETNADTMLAGSFCPNIHQHINMQLLSVNDRFFKAGGRQCAPVLSRLSAIGLS